jgi:RimJ/RimL family protein N-acetyltransferase
MWIKRKLMTRRLLLRRWRPSDKHDLFEYARLDAVGPPAGWPPHRSVEESERIIREFLRAKGTYAITLRGGNKVIGSIGLHYTELCNDAAGAEAMARNGLYPRQAGEPQARNTLELGYVLNPAFWGRGYVPEAASAVIEYAFCSLKADAIWCACFDYNSRSQRVCEKCGFAFMYSKQTVVKPLGGIEAVELVHCLTKERFLRMAAQRRSKAG